MLCITKNIIVIATKVRTRVGDGPNDEGLSRAHIFQAVEASLHRLGTDYIDLYQIHWPVPEEDLEEGWAAMARLKEEGKARYIGASSMAAWSSRAGTSRTLSLSA